MPAALQPQSQAQPPKSTALITGRVVDGATGQPIPEAVVALNPPGGRGAGRGIGHCRRVAGNSAGDGSRDGRGRAAAGRGATGQQRVMTGADGRFVFHSLPPGTVSAQRDTDGLHIESRRESVAVACGLDGRHLSRTFIDDASREGRRVRHRRHAATVEVRRHLRHRARRRR